MKNKTPQLSKNEEMLLIKYFDGECGYFARLRAKRLLSHETAREFLSSLALLGNQVKVVESAKQRVDLDLWDKISARIDQEERAEVYLGTRRAVNEERSERFRLTSLGWGVSGSLVAAGLVGLMFIGGQKVTQAPSQGDEFAKRLQRSLEVLDSQGNSRPAAQNINLQTSNINGRIPQLRRPVEVDWMRSDGRVHMIQDPNERSAIIWVKRQHPSLLAVEEGSDNQSLAASSDRPIILRERIPGSVNVSSQR